MTATKPAKRLGGVAIRLIVVAVFLGPILLSLISAFRPNGSIFKYSGTLSIHTFLPLPATLENFRTAVDLPEFVRQIANTFVLGLVQSTLTVMLAVLAAFPLSRMRFRGKSIVFYALIATMFIPFEALAVPMFLVVKQLGQLNSFWGLLLPWVAGPIATFILRQAMANIPRSLDEAVMIDGGGVFRIIWHVAIPSIWPSMVTVWLITFIYVWDSFLWPLIVVNSPEKQLAQVGIVNLINPSEINYGTLFGASIIAAAPVVLTFLLLQRFYRPNSAASGLK